MKALRPSVGVTPQEFVQRASVAAWSDEAHVEETRAVYARKRKLFLDLFASHGVRVAGSEATFYLWVAVPAGTPRSSGRSPCSRTPTCSSPPARSSDPTGRGTCGWRWCPRSRSASARRRPSTASSERRHERASTDLADLAERIERSWAEPDRLDAAAVEEAVGMLDRGELRVAEPDGDDWSVNEWAKKAVLLYFRVRDLDDDRGRPVRVPRPAAAEDRLRGGGRARRPARRPPATARTSRPAWC